MRIGYLVGSHVLQNHAIIPPLLQSMGLCGIEPDRIVVVVNGSSLEHEMTCRGVRFIFQQPESAAHCEAVRRFDEFSHWFFVNGTSVCGLKFRELVESGFDPEADCTHAGNLLALGKRGTHGRVINDLAMYRHDYLLSQADLIEEMTSTAGTQHSIDEMEGALYAVAPRKAAYPVTGHQVIGEARDVYHSGTQRITEYYPGIDWYRYKKNWGQMRAGTYKQSQL